jgi:hypothetical protein
MYSFEIQFRLFVQKVAIPAAGPGLPNNQYAPCWTILQAKMRYFLMGFPPYASGPAMIQAGVSAGGCVGASVPYCLIEL